MTPYPTDPRALLAHLHDAGLLARTAPADLYEHIRAVCTPTTTVAIRITDDPALPAPGAYTVGSVTAGRGEVLLNVAMHAWAAREANEPMPDLLADTLTHEFLHVAQEALGYLLTEEVIERAIHGADAYTAVDYTVAASVVEASDGE